jgi:periplasmic protein TonB
MREVGLGAAVSLAFHAWLLSLGLNEVRHEPMTPAIVARLVEPRFEPLPAPVPVERRTVRKVVAPAAAQPQLPEATTPGQYRYLLAAAAIRHNAYPPEALVNGWQGDVLVRVDVDAGGSVSGVNVSRGSDHAALDDQALEMFRNAAREVPVPRALWGAAFAVELRATYRADAATR